MLNRIIKYVLIALLTAVAVYEFLEVHIGNGIALLLLVCLVVLALIKHEVNILAFIQVRRNKFESAGKILTWVKKPEEMTERQRAYYYFLSGLISSQHQNLSASEKFFKKALNNNLRMKQDRAMAHLNLAGISMSKRRKREAMNHLTQVKKLDSQKVLADQVKMLRSQMGRI